MIVQVKIGNNIIWKIIMTETKISSILEFMKAIEEDTIEYKGIPLTKARLYRGVPNNKEHGLIP